DVGGLGPLVAVDDAHLAARDAHVEGHCVLGAGGGGHVDLGADHRTRGGDEEAETDATEGGDRRQAPLGLGRLRARPEQPASHAPPLGMYTPAHDPPWRGSNFDPETNPWASMSPPSTTLRAPPGWAAATKCPRASSGATSMSSRRSEA